MVISPDCPALWNCSWSQVSQVSSTPIPLSIGLRCLTTNNTQEMAIYARSLTRGNVLLNQQEYRDMLFRSVPGSSCFQAF